MKNKTRFQCVAALVLIVAAILSLGACSSLLMERDASVRFQNYTDFDLYYGVKFGDAEYIGYVASGFSTGYLDTEAGTYSLQARDASGNWITISSGSMSVDAGHSYTITGTGTGGSYYWILTQDS